jgi:plasmid stabilization system protein ParE
VEPDQYRIVWTPEAQSKLQEIVAEILEAAPSRAMPFARKIEKAAASLSWSPQRCSVTPENTLYRQLLVKRYRVIFHIINDEVIVDTVLFPYQVFRPEMLRNGEN